MARTANTDGVLDTKTSKIYDESSKAGEGIQIVEKAISRKVVTLEGEEVRVAKFGFAEVQPSDDPSAVINAMLSLVPGDNTAEKLANIVAVYNLGRYVDIRSAINNDLGGLSAEQKAFNRVIAAMRQLPLYKGQKDEALVNLLKSKPELMALFGVSISEDSEDSES